MKRGSRNLRGSRTSSLHDELYWERMRRDFKTCTYQNGKAYSPIEVELNGAGVDEFRALLRMNEARYRNWLSGREQRQNRRLGRAEAYAKTKRPLD